MNQLEEYENGERIHVMYIIGFKIIWRIEIKDSPWIPCQEEVREIPCPRCKTAFGGQLIGQILIVKINWLTQF